MRDNTSLFILTMYSLCPGIAKITDSKIWFLVGLGLLVIYFIVNKNKTMLLSSRGKCFRVFMIIFVLYAIALGLLLLFGDMLDRSGFLIGLVNFIFPLSIILFFGINSIDKMLSDIPNVAMLHAMIGIILYPPIRPNIMWLERIGDTVLHGTMFLRMASVSGSLSFSTLMAIAFGVTLKNFLTDSFYSQKRKINFAQMILFFICGFFSLQRAAWLAIFLILFSAVIAAKWNQKRILIKAFSALVALSIVVVININISYEGIEFFSQRIGLVTGKDDSNIFNERSDQWANVGHNLKERPMGFGPGQLGQSVRDNGPSNHGLAIYDGDYFRIISEYGPIGIAVILVLIYTFFRAMRVMISVFFTDLNSTQIIYAAIMIGIIIQGLGTNVTELYFVNSIYWVVVFRQWKINI